MSYETTEMWDAIKKKKYSLTLAELSSIFSSGGDFNLIMNGVLNTVAKAMHAEAGTLWYYDRSGDGLIRPRSVYGGGDIGDIYLLPGEGIAGKVIESGKAEVIADCSEDPRWAGKVDKSSGFVTKTMLCVPLCTTNGTAFACIQLINRKDDELFDNTDLDFVVRLSNEAAKRFDDYALPEFQAEKPVSEAAFSAFFFSDTMREMEAKFYGMREFIELDATERRKIIECARTMWKVFSVKREKKKNRMFKLF